MAAHQLMIKNIRLWRGVKAIAGAGFLLDQRLPAGTKLRRRKNTKPRGHN